MKKVIIVICVVSGLSFGGGCKSGTWTSSGDNFFSAVITVGAMFWLASLGLCEEGYEAEFPYTTKLLLLKNGEAHYWYGEEKGQKNGSWAIKDGKLKLTIPDSGDVIYEKQSNGDLTCVAVTKEGEITAVPTEMQYILKSSSSLITP